MIDKALFIAVVALFTISLIMSYSLTTFQTLYYHFGEMHFFVRQSVAILIGIVIMVVLGNQDSEKWFTKIGFTIFVLSFIAIIVMPFLPDSLSRDVLGAKRWIRLGVVNIAPVEFFKIGFAFFLSWSFSRTMIYKGKMPFKDEFTIVFPYLTIFAISVIFIAILQKDLGLVVVLAAMLMILFTFAGRSIKLFISMLSVGLIGFIVLVRLAPHRMLRVKSWWSTVQDSFLSYFPDNIASRLRVDSVTEPYQIANSLNSIHNGGLYGQGLGNGQFKLGFLSEVHTDFVLAGLTEEFGILGLAVVSVLILFIVYRIFIIASSTHNPIYHLFSLGVGLLIIFAFLVNSYGISGLIPIKGIAVPFLSYGGSHILASSIAIGMVLMISKDRDKNSRSRV